MYFQIINKVQNKMGNIFLLFENMRVLAFIIVLNTTLIAQWTTQSPVPTHLDIRGIGAPSQSHVFVATDDNSFDNGGALFESTDGGSTWTQLAIPVNLGQPLNGLFFLDSVNGWAFGNENYRTTDGGNTWEQIPFLGSTYFMEFYTANFGLATGNFGQQVSLDGGLSWNQSPNDMFGFDFFDDLNGFGVSTSGAYKTTDGGQSFNLSKAGSADDVKFLSSSTLVGIIDSFFVRSVDGGLNWTTGSDAEGRTNLLVVSENIVLAWGRSGSFPDYDDRVFRSSDGGQTWIDLGEIMNPNSFTSDIAFTVVDPQNIVSTDGSGNMYNSIDAGLTWSQVFQAPPGIIPGFLNSSKPVFSDAQNGYFGFGPGYIIKTTNGGASWFQISNGSGNTLNEIADFPNGNMIAVGENGTVLTKSNSSTQWIIQPFVTQNDLKSLQVLNNTDVIIADNSGQLYFSSNSGNNWTSAVSAPSGLSDVEDIHFDDLQNGWVVGSGFSQSAVYRTTNGGNTWIPVTEIQGTYLSIDKEGSSIWIAGTAEMFYKSSDNGVSWQTGNLSVSAYNIKDMDFFNSDVGYAVGGVGEIYKSTNGGSTWQLLQTPNSSIQFTDLFLNGANEFWVSTNSNKVYYSANGGLTWAVLEIGSNGFGTFNSVIADSNGNAWTAGYQGFIEFFQGPPPPPLNQPPTAAFDFSINGLTVNFTDNSNDVDGSIIQWDWNFGDGLFSTEQNPTHIYDTADTYVVWLKVTDDDGSSDSTLRIITVQPNPGGTFGDFTEVTPLDSVFVTPQDEDFWVITTAPADYDADGDLDIAVLGYYVVYNQSVDYRLLLLVNNGPASPTQWDFSYLQVPLGSLYTGESDMAWGDADGDGDQDLALGTNGETVIYKNDSGSLVLSNTNLPGYWEDNSQAEFDLRSLAWTDFDNDGDLDLLIPSVYVDSTFSYKTILMRNDSTDLSSNVIFTQLDTLFAPTSHASTTWADFDNDLDLDLLLVNLAPLTNEGFIKRYRNEGNGSFVEEDILGALTVEHGEAQWGDYDADGDLDVLIAGNVKELNGTFNLALRIYRNDNESYTPIEVIPCIACEGWFDLTAASWADYDSDGDMDILLAGNYNSGSQIEGRARIYANDGNGNFNDSGNELPAPRASGDRGGTFSWLDIDGDGDLDYFIAGQYFVPGGNGLVEAQMHIYRNDSPGQNNAPSNPDGLTAVAQSSNSVLLSWNPSTDDHTPSAALTYDLKIFRNGVQVTGAQRLPEPGIVNSATEWLLANLPDGNYDWTLRAVDASFSGSDLIVGQFNIGATSVEDDLKNLPNSYAINQNYPNPFNPLTRISWQSPVSSHHILKIYDVLGKEVATLVDEIKPAGRYEIDFDGSDLASGVYLYRLQAGSFVQTRKMILLK